MEDTEECMNVSRTCHQVRAESVQNRSLRVLAEGLASKIHKLRPDVRPIAQNVIQLSKALPPIWIDYLKPDGTDENEARALVQIRRQLEIFAERCSGSQ